MFRYSPITFRLFMMLLLLIGSIFGSIYWLTVPLIKENVFGLELHSNRQVLNIVYDLANRMHFSTESYVEQALSAQEQKLRAVVALTESKIERSLARGRARGESDKVIWQQIYADLRELQFGKDNYVWVSDYNARLLSHPDDKFQGRDLSVHRVGDNPAALPTIIRQAVADGEGFYKYKWYRLDSEEVIDKYSFVRSYPKWGIMLGAGVYADDLDRAAQVYKARLVQELSRALQNVKIASNGYLYVFDSKGEMIYHPNANIHGTNFRTLKNPVTGNLILDDLIAVADTGEELYYKWDTPNDPGNYAYEKLSLVRHLSGFDWYISSSVYLDDLKASSVQLSQRIMAMGFFGLLATVVAAFLFAEYLTSPIKQLSATAYKISRGQISAKTGIERGDELGTLAESFDYMVDQLRENIHSLNSRVSARTRELSESNQQLLQAVGSLKQTKSELTAAETRQRLILDALPAQVAYTDAQSRYIFVNREYAEMLGVDKSDIVGRTVADVMPVAMYEEVNHYIARALQGEKVAYEYSYESAGEEHVTRRTLLPLYTEDQQRVEGVLNLSIDITAEKNSEKRLAEASKMKAVGQMSGGMAHDFNNLLTIILGNLLEMQSSELLPEALQRNLAPAIRATRRGGDLTRRLLAFSRRQPLSPDYISPPALIDELVGLLSAPLPENICIQTRIDDEVPMVYVDAAQMEDALVNMALNAADAMARGGTLSIEMDQVVCDEGVELDEPVRPGSYTRICVKDTGVGFSEEALKKAFEPFFTTKSTGAGSGLGLSMVYGFVKQSQGYIEISNRAAGGAQVTILLPAVDAPEQAYKDVLHSDGRPLASSARASSLVLLVEDNPDVRSVVRNQLVTIGFTVIEAASADEAMPLLEQIPELAGVVSDVVMPGQHDGYDVARQARALHGAAFVVLMSGYSDRNNDQAGEFALLQKPFDAAALARMIFPDSGKV